MPWALLIRVLLAAAAGAGVGSFLTVVADTPTGRWYLRRRSRCPRCGEPVRALDLIPVASFFLLRGRCRSCARPIPRWHLATELAAVAVTLLAAIVARDRPLTDLATLWAALAVLLALTVVDLRHFLLPDALVGALAVIGVVRSLLLSQPGFERSLLGGTAGLLALGALAAIPWPKVRVGGPPIRLRHPPSLKLRRTRGYGGSSMGLGDVKLAGAMGIALGLPGLFFALFFAFVVGGGVGAALVLTGRAGLKSHIPFGPFLAGATAVVLLFPALPSVFFRLLGFGVE